MGASEQRTKRSQSYLSTGEMTVLLQAKDKSPEAKASPEQVIAETSTRSDRRLHRRAKVQEVLDLSEEQVQYLINTRQITAIRIAGEERFCSRDIDRLIEGYKATASRRPL